MVGVTPPLTDLKLYHSPAQTRWGTNAHSTFRFRPFKLSWPSEAPSGTLSSSLKHLSFSREKHTHTRLDLCRVTLLLVECSTSCLLGLSRTPHPLRQKSYQLPSNKTQVHNRFRFQKTYASQYSLLTLLQFVLRLPNFHQYHSLSHTIHSHLPPLLVTLQKALIPSRDIIKMPLKWVTDCASRFLDTFSPPLTLYIGCSYTCPSRPLSPLTPGRGERSPRPFKRPHSPNQDRKAEFPKS